MSVLDIMMMAQGKVPSMGMAQIARWGTGSCLIMGTKSMPSYFDIIILRQAHMITEKRVTALMERADPETSSSAM